MHQFNGFADLRLNSQHRATETTLWPSFTDIMTVILMVFMLTMVVVIVKNAHLVDRVRLSQQRQDEAEARLQANLAEMIDLRHVNTDLEDALRSKEMEIILLNDETNALQANLDAKLAIIDRLEDEKLEIQENVRVLRLQLREQEDEINSSEERLAAVSEEARQQEDILNRQIAALLSQLDEKEALLVTLGNEKSDLELALARQRQDFSSLEDKYLRLIRPARSSMGKLVATVQIARVGGKLVYHFRDIDGGELETVTPEEMHRRLAALKAAHGDELYVKIVIPENSGLSYNEAWDFTKDILSRYDYYYKDGWPGEEGKE